MGGKLQAGGWAPGSSSLAYSLSLPLPGPCQALHDSYDTLIHQAKLALTISMIPRLLSHTHKREAQG